MDTDYDAYSERDDESSSPSIPVHSGEASFSMADVADTADIAANPPPLVVLGATFGTFAGLLATASVVTAAVAMLLEASIFVCVCFSFPIMLAPVVVYQRTRIEQEKTFREVSNKVREEVNKFAMENSLLQGEVSRMQRQVTRLSAVEERFKELCAREGRRVDRMKGVVKMNAAFQDEIRVLQAADEFQTILAAIMEADKDQDSFISEKELDELVLRWRVFGGRRKNSRFDEEAIRAAFKKIMTEKGVSFSNIHNAMQLQNEQNQSQNDEDDSHSNPPNVAQTPICEKQVEPFDVEKDLVILHEDAQKACEFRTILHN
mmetsp:Transcript_4719/g.8767  ORF Transcript_4719/g.8767 Transcript_4719/m.8767 type:complete len:318 (+) Transcript_4719:49-1002(+)